MENIKWKKVETKTDFIKLENIGDSVEGIYLMSTEGDYKNKVYVIEVDGVQKKISGKVLDTSFAEIKEGSAVKIKYLGIPKGKQYNDYEVFVGEIKK